MAYPIPGTGKDHRKDGLLQTNLFGRCARTQLMPIYKKFYAIDYVAKLSDSYRRIFS